MYSTTGIFFGETATLRPFDKRDFSAALKVLLEQFFTHLFCWYASEVAPLISLGFGFFCCWFSTSDSNFSRCLYLEVLCSFNYEADARLMISCAVVFISSFFTRYFSSACFLHKLPILFTICVANLVTSDVTSQITSTMIKAPTRAGSSEQKCSV